MASVMQGDAYNIPVTIKSGNGTLITPEIAACVEITVGQFTKRWPGQVTFDEKTGEWQFPVTQKQTFRFAPGAAVVQARVVFQDGSIMGGSGAPIRVAQSASHGTLPQPEKTEAVTGGAPKATEVTIPTVHDIDVSLHSQVILSDPIKAPYIGDNGNWYEYDAATGTFVDTGTSASGTPPITPDTAGKYLTNNGSKAEWGEVKESVEVGDAKDGNLLKLSGSDVLNAATPNVDYALPTLYVTITQDGQDSDGNPIYKSDKTYEEIKAAHKAGREVKIGSLLGHDIGEFSQMGITELNLGIVDDNIKNVQFSAFGIPTVNVQGENGVPARRGGFLISYIDVSIYEKNSQIFVNSSFDLSTQTFPEPGETDLSAIKLPQQYIIHVYERVDGTLTADWTYDEIQKTIDAYNAGKSGAALFCVKNKDQVYQISEYIPYGRTIVFMTFSYDGFVKLILSNSTEKDVWTKKYFQPWQLKIPVTTADNGKFLRVVNGQWAAEAVANAKGVSF